jgi:hypothetical protein
MSTETPANLTPEVVTPDLISRCISATNKIWNRTYYGNLIIKQGLQIAVTPSLPEHYLNSAQNVKTSDLAKVEELMFQTNIKTPAIYIDPTTPNKLVEQLKNANYVLQPDETEIWRILDLEKTILDANNILKLPESDVILETWNINDISEDALSAFLSIDKETNGINEETIKQLRNNLETKRDPDTEILILLTKVRGKYAACLCLGIADGISNISEAGTLEEFRGNNIFPWMRINAAKITKERGGKLIVSNTLASNTSSHRSSDKSGFIRGFERHLYVKSN